MGFLMTDQDIHLLDDADQEMLWSSLPLKNGLIKEEAVAEPPVPEQKAQPEAKPVAAKPASEPQQTKPKEEPKQRPHVEVAKPTKVAEQNKEPADNVDDLLAAVEAMRAKRPGVRARKVPPSPEEMLRRRQQLRETVGRILASL